MCNIYKNIWQTYAQKAVKTDRALITCLKETLRRCNITVFDHLKHKDPMRSSYKKKRRKYTTKHVSTEVPKSQRKILRKAHTEYEIHFF